MISLEMELPLSGLKHLPAVVDGHFLVPVLGLKNSVPFEKLPPWTSYNLRGGSR